MRQPSRAIVEKTISAPGTLWRPPGLTIQKAGDIQDGAALMDSYTNLANNMGRLGKDPVASTVWEFQSPLDYATLQNVYRFDGIIRRHIEITIKEMTRRSFTVTGDNDGLIPKYLEQKGFFKQTPMALRWGMLYGGAIGVILCDDGQKDLSKPLNENALQNLYGMNVFDRWRVTYTLADMYTDPTHPKYMWPKRYWVFPIGIGEPFVVHESRVVRIDGAPLPEIDRQANNYWFDSELQAPYKAVMSLMAVYGYAEGIMADFVQGVLGISGLSDKIAAGNWDAVANKMRVVRLFKGNTNVIPYDLDGEKYEKIVSSVAGLKDIMDQFWALWSSVTGYPQTIWQGRSPSGLNATGDNEMQMFEDAIHGRQTDKLGPWWERLTYLTYKCKKGPTGGVVPPDFKIEFPPLSQPSEKAQADVDNVRSQTDERDIKNNVISPAEARSRKGPGSKGIVLDKKFMPPDTYEKPEPPQLPAKQRLAPLDGD